ncbi:MAG: hypothetical protein HY722_14005 [Planctomycetes bacterium]|nr:hypothetical protein [Planctomycetota bacterium]
MASSRRRTAAAVAVATLLLVAGAIYLRPRSRGEDAPMVRARPPLAATSVEGGGFSPAPGPDATPPGLESRLDALLAAVPVQALSGPPGPARVLEEAARPGRSLDPVGLGAELVSAMDASAGGPAEAARALVGGVGGASEALLFTAARALATRVDEEAARILAAGLVEAAETRRPHLVVALGGSNALVADRALVDAYAGALQPGEVRAAAAFALGTRLARLPGADRDRAARAAWADLDSADPARVEAAADVLGSGPLSPAEEARLLARLALDQDPDRRAAALRALVAAGTEPARLSPALQGVAADPAAPEVLRELARVALAALGE